MKETHGVYIREAYKDYTPPFDAVKVVDRLLNGIPKKYLAGLHTVVITNMGHMSREERRRKTKSRKRKVILSQRGGSYCEQWKGEPAHIQLILDNIIGRRPKWLLRFPYVQDTALATVLFHEIGHHIHKTQAPESRERENVAEDWCTKLLGLYIDKQYGYLQKPMNAVFWTAIKPIIWFLERLVRTSKRSRHHSQRRTHAG